MLILPWTSFGIQRASLINIHKARETLRVEADQMHSLKMQRCCFAGLHNYYLFVEFHKDCSLIYLFEAKKHM